MTEYTHVEKPFLDQLRSLGWTVADQGRGVPSEPTKSLRTGFREWILPEIFSESIRHINALEDGTEWLTERQMEDLKDQILRQPNSALLEANENVQRLFLKIQVDVNEVTGESDPVVKLILHWKCMMAPQKIVDYIIVHELCHRHHRDHDDAFWNEVDKVMRRFYRSPQSRRSPNRLPGYAWRRGPRGRPECTSVAQSCTPPHPRGA